MLVGRPIQLDPREFRYIHRRLTGPESLRGERGEEVGPLGEGGQASGALFPGEPMASPEKHSQQPHRGVERQHPKLHSEVFEGALWPGEHATAVAANAPALPQDGYQIQEEYLRQVLRHDGQRPGGSCFV